MASAGRRAITVIAALGSAAALFATAGVSTAEAASSSGVATTTVNIRTGASTSAPVVGRLVRGQQIKITGAASGDWVKVRFRSRTAFMDGEYLDRSGARPAAPNGSRRPAPGSPPPSSTSAPAPAPAIGWWVSSPRAAPSPSPVVTAAGTPSSGTRARCAGSTRPTSPSPSASPPARPRVHARRDPGRPAGTGQRIDQGGDRPRVRSCPARRAVRLRRHGSEPLGLLGAHPGGLARGRGLDPPHHVHPGEDRPASRAVRPAPRRSGLLLRFPSQPRRSVRWQRDGPQRPPPGQDRLLQQDQLDAVRRRRPPGLTRPERPLMTVFDGRAPRSAVLSSAVSHSFVTIPSTRLCSVQVGVSAGIAPALPRGSAHDRCRRQGVGGPGVRRAGRRFPPHRRPTRRR